MSALTSTPVASAQSGLDAMLLLRSDRNYFRAGARIETIGPYRIVAMDGLTHVEAGCIVETPASDAPWSPLLAFRLRTLRAASVRCYVPGYAVGTRSTRFGASCTVELLLSLQATSEHAIAVPENVRVRLASPRDDDIKRRLFGEDRARPDGKAISAADYVALERRKIADGYMCGYIVERDGEDVGCFSLSRESDLIRLKNLFIASSARGTGCGEAALAFALDHARLTGARAVGALAIAGSAGHRLYTRVGLSVVGAQTEISMPLRHHDAEGCA